MSAIPRAKDRSGQVFRRLGRAVPFVLLLAMLMQSAALAGPRTCLVLGGGGARGGAHVGVLKVLERAQVPIDCIAGTSMGAIVGAMYASGYKAAEIEEILTGLDWVDTFRDDPPRRKLPMRRKDEDYRLLVDVELGFRDGKLIGPWGLIQGQKMLLAMRRFLLPTAGIDDFDQLPIPFRAVATDLADGSAHVFARGDLAMAVRASMSVPGAFQPVRVDGRLLVDGFIANNVPVDVARSLGATRLIVVDVSDPPKPTAELGSAIAVSAQALTLLSSRETRRQLSTLGEEDLLLSPELGNFSAAGFDRLAEAIAIGEAIAERHLADLARYSVADGAYSAFAARHQPPDRNPPRLDFVRTVESRSASAAYVATRVAHLEGQPFDLDELEATLNSAYGEGQYERITWREVRDGEARGIEVTPVDKGWGPNFLKFGFGIADDLRGGSSYQIGADLRLTGIGRRGGEWRSRIELGSRTRFASEFYQRFGERGAQYLRPYGEYGGRLLRFQLSRDEDNEYWLRRARLGLEGGYTPNDDWRLYAALEGGYTWAILRTGRPLGAQVERPLRPPRLREGERYGLLGFGFARDTLSNPTFPTHGTRSDLRVDLFAQALGSKVDEQRVQFRYHHAVNHAQHHLLFGFEAAAGIRESGSLQARNFLGGLGRLSGYGENELSGQYTGLARALWYRRFGDASALFATPVYLGASLELGGVFERRSAIQPDNLAYAGSLFLGIDTFLGPMFLGFGANDAGRQSLYLRFGSLIETIER